MAFESVAFELVAFTVTFEVPAIVSIFDKLRRNCRDRRDRRETRIDASDWGRVRSGHGRASPGSGGVRPNENTPCAFSQRSRRPIFESTTASSGIDNFPNCAF